MHVDTIRRIRPLFVAALVALSAGAATAQESPAAAVEEATVTLTAEERARYVGTYEMETPEGSFKIFVYEEGGKLMGRPEAEDEPSPLIPLGEHRFRPELMSKAVITFAVDGDRAINFTLDFNDERGSAMAFRQP